MLKVLKTADKIFAQILKTILVLLCIGVACLMMTQVIIRIPALFRSMAWSAEVREAMMAWMVMIGGTLLFRDGKHFRVELMEIKYGDKLWMRIINLMISALCFAFMALLLYYSIRFLQAKPRYSFILKFNTQYVYASVPVNAALSLIYLLRDLIINSVRLKRPDFAKPAPTLCSAETAESSGQE